MKILRGFIIALLLVAVIGCGKTETYSNWELVEMTNDTWSFQIEKDELENINSAIIELQVNDLVVDYKNGNHSRVIIDIDGKSYKIDIDILLGNDMAGRIVINDIKISGDSNYFANEFDGLITRIKVIVILDHKPSNTEINNWNKNNRVELKY